MSVRRRATSRAGLMGRLSASANQRLRPSLAVVVTHCGNSRRKRKRRRGLSAAHCVNRRAGHVCNRPKSSMLEMRSSPNCRINELSVTNGQFIAYENTSDPGVMRSLTLGLCPYPRKPAFRCIFGVICRDLGVMRLAANAAGLPLANAHNPSNYPKDCACDTAIPKSPSKLCTP